MKTPKGCIRVKVGQKIKDGDSWGDHELTKVSYSIGEKLLRGNLDPLFRPIKRVTKKRGVR